MPVPALVAELIVILSRLPPLVKEILTAAGIEFAFRGVDALAAELGESDAIISALLEPGPETRAAMDRLLKLLNRPDIKRSFDQEQAAPLVEAAESLEGKFGDAEKVFDDLSKAQETLNRARADLNEVLEGRSEEERAQVNEVVEGRAPPQSIDKELRSIANKVKRAESELAEIQSIADSIRSQNAPLLREPFPEREGHVAPDLMNETVSPAGSDTSSEFIQRLDDASLTFDALVQAFGEAVGRVDESSKRFKEAIDGLIGPGGEAEEEAEPGFQRAAFVTGGGATGVPVGVAAGAAVVPVDETFARASAAVKGFVAETEESLGLLGELFGATFQGFERELVDALETGKLEWRDFARVAVEALGQILAEQVKLAFGDEDAPGGGFGDLIGGILSGVIAGAFAHGGRPAPGLPALVGEAGPELFVPDSAGTILPNDLLGAVGGGETVITVTLNAPIDARGAEFGVERRIAQAMAQAEQRISQNVMARIVHSAQRGGVFARLPRR